MSFIFILPTTKRTKANFDKVLYLPIYRCLRDMVLIRLFYDKGLIFGYIPLMYRTKQRKYNRDRIYKTLKWTGCKPYCITVPNLTCKI